MLRLTLCKEEYLRIGKDVKIVFLGGTNNHLRIMVDAPKEFNVVRSKVIERNTIDPQEKAKLPHYHAVADTPERYRKKRVVINDNCVIKERKEKIDGKEIWSQTQEQA